LDGCEQSSPEGAESLVSCSTVNIPDAQQLSIVIPAWNEEAALPPTLDGVVAVLKSHDLKDRTEIIVVSDGSTDATIEAARTALEGRVTYTVVDLARNVGSHAAIRCGLSHAAGERIVILSADGQDPPETIPLMLKKLETGSDIVWGQRSSRGNDPMAKRASAGMFYRMFQWLTGLEYPPSGLDFVGFTCQVNDAIAQYRERNLPLFLLIYNLGYTQAVVPYERAERVAGTSGWSLRKRVTLAVDMLTAFSAAPMRLISLVGVIVAVLGLGFGLFTMIRAILTDVAVSGWSSMIVLTSLMSGTILLGMAALGEYVWRSLDEARARPIYLERRVLTSDENNPSPDQ
jgi:glycosyltransferase involved in cell wall biosynthesis